MKILMHDQGSEAWKSARLGVVTASEVDALVSPTGKVRTGEGVKTYLCKKAGEKLFGYAEDFGGTYSTGQGHFREAFAVPMYSGINDVKVQRVGFCTSDDGKIGFSPDGLVGEDGGLEIKSPGNTKMIEYLLAGVVPPEHFMQVQFSLYVSGRAWWDFMAYHKDIDPLIVRVLPCDDTHAAFKTALAQFLPQLDAATAKVLAMMNTQPTQT